MSRIVVPSRRARTVARQVAQREQCSIHGWMRVKGCWVVNMLELVWTPMGTLEQWRDDPEKYQGRYRKPRSVKLPETVQ